ncbi:hypothetical protein [Paraclostridium sordellii]|nr:hypothetical protein [Paeniclostridium sordellii]MCR1847946.1 hypothetical protein [Paeniclostridium sordellii]
MIGFDYSIQSNMMVVGYIEFINLISETQILGIGYMSIPQGIMDI